MGGSPNQHVASIAYDEDSFTNHKGSEYRVTKRVRVDSSVVTDPNKDTFKSGNDHSMEKKKELNRKSASECRKRRKEYVSQLENKVDQLENEVYSLKRKLRYFEQGEKMKKLSEKENIIQYLIGKYDDYDKLDVLIKDYDDKEDESAEICKIINTIKYKQGSQGYVRKQTVNYLLKKVIEKMMPSHVKYIVSSCSNENGYFEKARGRKLAKNLQAKTQRGKYDEYTEKCQDPEGHIWKEIIWTIGLNSEEIKLLKKQRSKILKLNDKFSSNLHKFLKTKKEMFNISSELEAMLDDVGKNVKPIQLARFLKYVDRIKHEKELSLFELWGIKSNKMKVKIDKLGTNGLPNAYVNKSESTFTMLKKKEKKLMKSQVETKIDMDLEKTRKIFESNHGAQSSTQAFKINEESPEELASQILKNSCSYVPDLLPMQMSDDSGLPDSVSESDSDDNN